MISGKESEAPQNNMHTRRRSANTMTINQAREHEAQGDEIGWCESQKKNEMTFARCHCSFSEALMMCGLLSISILVYK